MSFIKKKRQARFAPALFEESTAYLTNPACGWYRIYPFGLGEETDLEELRWSLREEESLALVLADIGAFRDSKIPQDALLRFEEILGFFQAHGKDVILRVVYDREGRGMEREPEFLKTVLGHIRQVGASAVKFRRQIAVAQGLFVGNWGEMHGSKFLSEERLRQLMQAWREAFGDIPAAVRTPQQWWMLHPAGEGTGDGRIGLFNDGMFGSADDLGTFGSQEAKEAGWLGRWDRQEELAFIGRASARVPYGGEAVSGLSIDGKEAARELRLARATYLNRTHDAARLKEWEAETWEGDGPWDGCSALHYIGCHLGYRLVVRGAELFGKKDRALRIWIENTGFAPLYEEAELALSVKTAGGRAETVVLPERLRGVRPQEKREMSVALDKELEENARVLSLSMRRKRDGRTILFANPSGADGSVCLGTFMK